MSLKKKWAIFIHFLIFKSENTVLTDFGIWTYLKTRLLDLGSRQSDGPRKSIVAF
jgi:hypothetical protein